MPVARRGRSRENGHPFGFAGLTAFGFVLEMLVVEEQLFSGSKYEIRPAVGAGEYLVLKFHLRMAPLCPWSPRPHAGKRVTRCNTGLCTSPLNRPWTRPATHPTRGVDTTLTKTEAERNDEYRSIPDCNSYRRGPDLSRAAPGRGDPLDFSCAALNSLVLFFANLFSRTLASECGFHAFLLTGFQVEGVALYFLDNVFLLHLAFETAQSVFKGFSLLQTNFRQSDTPPSSSGRTD
jgi:hypothetical protein